MKSNYNFKETLLTVWSYTAMIQNNCFSVPPVKKYDTLFFFQIRPPNTLQLSNLNSALLVSSKTMLGTKITAYTGGDNV